MVIKTVYHFVDSNLGVEISSKKKKLTEKEVRILEFVLPGRGQMTYLGGRRACLRNQG